MARLFIAGHETGDTSEWDIQQDARIATGISGMDGTYCLDMITGSWPCAIKYLGGNKTELYGYFLLRRVSSPSYLQCVFHLFDGSKTESMFVYLDSTNNYMQFDTYYGGTHLAASTIPFTVNTTFRVEFYIKISTATDGRIVLKINGTTDIDFTGITSTKTNVAYFGVGNCRRHAYVNKSLYYDNFILDDASWITLTGEQPHRISTLFPSADGTENALTPGLPVDINADKARWRFEAAGLTTDDKGNAALTAYGSPAADSADYREGSSCVKLVRTSSQYFKVLDSALPSDFPLKGGTANRVFTLCFWFKADTIPGSGVYQKIFAKENYGTDNSFEAYLTNSKFRLLWGTSATAATTWDVFTPTADKWYFVACKIHGDNRTWSVRVYDYDAGTWTTYTGTTPSAILRVSSDDLYIGCYRTPSDYFDGWLDNMRIYPVILTDPVLDLIRQNRTTYERFEAVNSIPPSDALHIKGHSDGDIQTFAMQDLVGSVESVKCIQAAVRNFLTGIPAAKNVTPVVRVSGTNYLGTAVQAPLWLAPEQNIKLWETNPYTATGWTKDDIDALECGLKLTA